MKTLKKQQTCRRPSELAAPPTLVYLKRGREPLDVGNWCFVSALQGRHGAVVHDGGLLRALGQVLEGKSDVETVSSLVQPGDETQQNSSKPEGFCHQPCGAPSGDREVLQR